MLSKMKEDLAYFDKELDSLTDNYEIAFLRSHIIDTLDSRTKLQNMLKFANEFREDPQRLVEKMTQGRAESKAIGEIPQGP